MSVAVESPAAPGALPARERTAAAAEQRGFAEGSAAAAVSEEVQSIFEYMPATLAGMIAVAGIVLMLFWPLRPAAVLLTWVAAFAVLWLARLVMLQSYRRAVRAGTVDWRLWLRVWNVSTILSGALWGGTTWLFYASDNSIQQTGLIIVVYSYCIAAVPVMANQPRVFALFAALCFAPMAVRIAMEGDLSSYQLAGELLLIGSLTTLLARSHRVALQRVTELKLRADELLARLRAEMQAAERARRDAEVANRSKTQFFAAASHDLRQPLHAMGLFAAALRQRSHDPAVVPLVNSINESVDALEGLFSELLDITKIDSGAVQVAPQNFHMAEIFRKLKLHFEPSAFEKGLALRFRGQQHAAHADPLLVDRILRNLVSNAIRYTDDGSVLVSCRARGSQVLLQVWDSGVGIDEAQQARVFEEFYQVPGDRAPSADQRKGLGLGLAIVHRLATLMGTPLELNSRPGRGTVFTLTLPRSEAPSAAPLRASPAPGHASVSLDGRLILIVEDEPSVREGLEVLLTGWGAAVLALPSVTAVEQWTESDATDGLHPALIISDYRLEPGRSGLDAIRTLRQRFGRSVPAIVVTGSTMSGHESEAAEHDFHLLVKPVLPNKLRAMISFKLASKTAPVLA